MGRKSFSQLLSETFDICLQQISFVGRFATGKNQILR